MSRLYVQNLPVYVTDDDLRKHFSSQGEITDVRVMMTTYGTSRRFGFVGYRTDEEATKAQHYFDKSYLDTSRLIVQFAKMVRRKELVF